MKRIAATVLIVAATGSQAASQPVPLDVRISLLHDSQYVTEGRDNLADGGLRTALIQASENNVTMLASIAEGTKGDYQEINYAIKWAWVGQAYEGYLGYGRLEYDQNGRDTKDTETTLGISTRHSAIKLAADATYSKQAKGYFVELSARKDWKIKTSLIYTSAVAGIDHDFASRDHHGENHYQLNLGTILPLNEFYFFEASVSHSFAGKGVEADGLDDQDFWSVVLHYQP
jgi:hypothetical protein